ncbi:phage head closure protein [Streptococcus sciuri]|uniref:Phage head closure protein n=1 Tax=Streptococcus sciuri TaxID=2973939 RepID=A0ABT2F7B6_9STRE|nr:phage head closure protein [Streptococcus sciuri]MCS4488380.1 phage head closure protein [Streptococcus sciuri]
MVRRLLPSAFNKKAAFCTMTSKPNAAGVNVPRLEVAFSLHVKPQKRTLNQQYQATQAGLSDTIVIVCRHTKGLKESYKVMMDGVTYDIVTISSDEGFGFSKYDYITLRAQKKVGR